jgi:tetratricopeptide (TPR) repeat protein
MKIAFIIWGVFLIMSSDAKTARVNFDSLWNYDNPAETETKFRDLLPDAKNSGDTGYYAELLTQIARTQSLQQQFDSANATLDTVQEMMGAAGKKAHVRYLLERGRTFNSAGKAGEAVPLFTEAWDLALKEHFDFYAVDAAHMMGIAAPADQQMDWNRKALDLAEKSSDARARKWQGSLYNNIGWTYFDQKKYDTALDLFQKAVDFRKEQGAPIPLRIAEWCVAKTYRMMGQVDTALAMQKKLLKEWQDSGEENDGYVYEELGECLLALNRGEEAAPYFAKAYEILSKDIWMTRDEPARLERMKELGKVK